MKKRSIGALVGVVLLSSVAVAGDDIKGEESRVAPFVPVVKAEKEVGHKGLKHFHDPFCMCNKSPLFTSHKYDGKVHGYLRVHHIFDGDSNGFDKNTGSTLGFGLKYDRHLFGGCGAGTGCFCRRRSHPVREFRRGATTASHGQTRGHAHR